MKIAVEIECDGAYCGDCVYKRRTSLNPGALCWIFQIVLYHPEGPFTAKRLRCKDCLSATIKE